MSHLRNALFQTRWSLRHYGLRTTLKSVLTHHRLPVPPSLSYPTHPFDLSPGSVSATPPDPYNQLDTSGFIPAHQLARGNSQSLNTTAYHAIPPSRFRSLMARWIATPPIEPLSRYTFIDLGCGKGRAVLLANQLPFLGILGIELDPTLARIAAQNLTHWQHTQPHPLPPTRILCDDAAAVALPGTPCVLYLYNPFHPTVVAQLLDHLRFTLGDKPAPLDILYFTPAAGSLFAAHPCLQHLWTESIPISAADAAAEPITDVQDLCSAYRWVGTSAKLSVTSPTNIS